VIVSYINGARILAKAPFAYKNNTRHLKVTAMIKHLMPVWKFSLLPVGFGQRASKLKSDGND
jgi:hypothetical protein